MLLRRRSAEKMRMDTAHVGDSCTAVCGTHPHTPPAQDNPAAHRTLLARKRGRTQTPAHAMQQNHSPCLSGQSFDEQNTHMQAPAVSPCLAQQGIKNPSSIQHARHTRHRHRQTRHDESGQSKTARHPTECSVIEALCVYSAAGTQRQRK
mmetsp:Transcript_16469/g.39537  ORF Transcript_16469/g.39537 Transcript_16469/m.39537 type:complete len:150 (-) Transcript_16469:2198-2647(-)